MLSLWKGFRLGMLLQVAVGPVCLFIFNAAARQGFTGGLTAAGGTVLVDTAMIVLAALGVGTLIQNRPAMKNALNITGIIILTLFGMAMVLGTAGIKILPAFTFASSDGTLFWQAVLLTASNPLTVIFWAGVFAVKTTSENITGTDLGFFSAGCMLSSAVFLAFISAAGAFSGTVLPPVFLKALNTSVGLLLLGFAAKRTYTLLTEKLSL